MKKAYYLIKDEAYKESNKTPEKGDLVFDKGDKSWGTVCMVHPDNKHIAIGEEDVIELGVPIDRCVVLVKDH